jgi:exonuclease V gamma subunit
LVGALDRLWPEGRIQVGFGRIDRRGEFDVWIRHLFLCAAVEDGLDYPAKSILVGRTKDRKSVEHVVVFEPVADSKSHLARLFEWAWLASTSPLPFFPKASKDFAELALEGKLDQAWRKAQQTYYGGDSGGFLMPEFDEELEHARLWEGVSPLEPGPDMPLRFRFDELAETFFQPLFAARQVEIE